MKILTLALIVFLSACGNSAKPVESSVDQSNQIIRHGTPPRIENEECMRLYDLAIDYAKKGDHRTEQTLLLKCKKLEPNNGTVLNALGVSYYALNDSTTALEYYFLAIKADSLMLSAYENAGVLLEMRGKYVEATKILKMGLAKSDTNNFTHYNICFTLAITYFNMGSCVEAKNYLSIAKQRNFNILEFTSLLDKFEAEVLKQCN